MPAQAQHSTDHEDIDALVRRFEACALAEDEWDHRAHLLVAAWYVLNDGVEGAMEKMRLGINRINAVHSVKITLMSGYHETLTRVWLVLVADALNQQAAVSQQQRILHAVDALSDKRLVLHYYTRQTLFADDARSGWRDPDKAPLPKV